MKNKTFKCKTCGIERNIIFLGEPCPNKSCFDVNSFNWRDEKYRRENLEKGRLAKLKKVETIREMREKRVSWKEIAEHFGYKKESTARQFWCRNKDNV